MYSRGGTPAGVGVGVGVLVCSERGGDPLGVSVQAAVRKIRKTNALTNRLTLAPLGLDFAKAYGNELKLISIRKMDMSCLRKGTIRLLHVSSKLC